MKTAEEPKETAKKDFYEDAKEEAIERNILLQPIFTHLC